MPYQTQKERLPDIYSQLPTIVNEMGITSNSNQTQLFSVIPYAVATPVTGKPGQASAPMTQLPRLWYVRSLIEER